MTEELKPETKTAVNLEVQRLFRESGQSHRDFLEVMFKRLVSGVSALLAIALTFFFFLTNKNLSEINDDVQTTAKSKVNSFLQDYLTGDTLDKGLESRITLKIPNILDKENVKLKIEAAILERLPSTLERGEVRDQLSAEVRSLMTTFGNQITIDQVRSQIESNLQSINFDSFPVGSIIMFGGSEAPFGWEICNGKPLPRAQFRELFSKIGTTYGSTDNSHFRLPDLRGRSPIGFGTGNNLTTRSLGTMLGAEVHTLTIEEMPRHTHDLQENGKKVFFHSPGAIQGSDHKGGGEVLQKDLHVGSTGSNKAHNNIQPSLVVNFIIKAK